MNFETVVGNVVLSEVEILKALCVVTVSAGRKLFTLETVSSRWGEV